ncbi:protein trichome birefringence-like 34 [Salvia miltiorrhiza]|uniref:protein trichome birefringence-like 34 n=1 Tax=Salvia miltiorrhiza TaxID=226208 RepID=UPI0025ABA9A4|nr:protein trichome birefringence-like 34 [Salvia miltiorrhiza]
MHLQTRKSRNNYAAAFFFLLAFMLIAIAFLQSCDNRCMTSKLLLRQNQEKIEAAKISNSSRDCNLFSGNWVFDNVSYPLYKERACSFMTDEHACLKFGRKDVGYQKWRWQPHHCHLPRFNGTTLLERIRGKRIVFVGDSLNRNQWASLLCLIEPSLNQSSPKLVIKKGNSLIFEAIEYEATIEFYWSPFLVESNCDDPFHHTNLQNRTIKIMAIEKHASQWRDADFVVFDSYAWWLDPNITLLWESVGSSDPIYKRVSQLPSYEMALNKWSQWLEININRTKTKLFFMGPSPRHTSKDERGDVVAMCHDKIEPILKVGEQGIGIDRDMMHVANSVVKKMKTRGINIEYLNISHMSNYRLDAHPSIYRKFFHPLSKGRLANPKNYADCLHWCLPGLPDVWNEILYTYIIRS